MSVNSSLQQKNPVTLEKQVIEPSKYDMNFMSLYYSEMINTIISLYTNPSEHIPNYHIFYTELSEETREEIIEKVRQLGSKIGNSLAKVSRTEKNTLVQNIKCLCKEVYPCLYQRPIDSLKTNHKGDYYLVDKMFDFSYKDKDIGALYTVYHVMACSIMRAFMNCEKDVQYRVDDDNNNITYIISIE
ncbi:hypothetical protein ACO0OE_003348 [Hanseniaspora uvarum]